jgi:hypothetical protein
MVMMGFLNKFMDAISVELEAPTVAEVTLTMGADWSAGKAGRDLDPTARPSAPPPTDSLLKKLSVLRFAPNALRLDKQWQQGVPGAWPAVGEFLRERTGHDFPVLARLQHSRGIKAVASMLRENLDPATTVIGLKVKTLAGLIFATVIADESLAAEVRLLGSKQGITPAQLDEAVHLALDPTAEPSDPDPKVRAALVLARAAAPSPADITPQVVEICRQSELSAPAIVELITWLSVLQMLHRLSSYFVAERR